MQEWSTPLVLATGAFLAVLLWRVRPAWPWGGKRRASRQALRDARARIETAKDGPARALALCDAADLSTRGSAAGLYQRALRTDPGSAEVVRRAVAALTSRPRALESLLWRALAAAPWTGDSRDAARLALEALGTLYDGPLKNAVRARAFTHARDALS
jgi:hypothetical protein